MPNRCSGRSPARPDTSKTVPKDFKPFATPGEAKVSLLTLTSILTGPIIDSQRSRMEPKVAAGQKKKRQKKDKNAPKGAHSLYYFSFHFVNALNDLNSYFFNLNRIARRAVSLHLIHHGREKSGTRSDTCCLPSRGGNLDSLSCSDSEREARAGGDRRDETGGRPLEDAERAAEGALRGDGEEGQGAIQPGDAQVQSNPERRLGCVVEAQVVVVSIHTLTDLNYLVCFHYVFSLVVFREYHDWSHYQTNHLRKTATTT